MTAAEQADDFTDELRERYAEAAARTSRLRSAADNPEARTRSLAALLVLPSAAEMDRMDAEVREERDRELEQQSRDRRVARVRAVEALGVPLKAADEQALADGIVDLSFGPSIRAVAAWLADDAAQPILLLCGTVGRGKTLAAAWAVLERGGDYVRARELEQLRMAGYGDDAARFKTLCRKRSLLAVDDIGREESSERMTSALLDVVDERRGRGHRTILIANMTGAGFKAAYGNERLLSRMTESAQWVIDAGADARRRQP